MRPLEPEVSYAPDEQPGQVKRTWYHTLGIVLFIVVCFEVGAFLIVFPWTPQWDANSLVSLFPGLRGVWGSSYFRGALSGLGLLNIFISFGEVSRLRRPRADKLKVSTL